MNDLHTLFLSQKARVSGLNKRAGAGQQFETFLEKTIDGAALVVDGKITKFNARFVEMMGRPAEELRGLSPTEFIAPEERPRVAERIQAVLAGGPEFPSEYEVLRPDGSTLPVEVMSQLVEYGGGSAVLSVLRDVTERIEAERALRASEEMFRSLAETTKAAIFIIQGARVAYMNPAAEILAGLTMGEVNKLREPWNFIHPDDRGAVQERITRRDSGEDVSTPYEYRIIRKTGEERWVEATTTMINFEGKPAGLAVAIDITERVRAQEALRQAREELEDQIERNMQPRNPYKLTFRELVVLRLIADGRADKEVASDLDISPLTAQKHSANILSKMNASSRTEASVRALREGLIE